ncbi:MAG: hypothetical protein MJ181_06510 [Treponema sp.]|nr:hypothetical protein [Treponema sp.]
MKSIKYIFSILVVSFLAITCFTSCGEKIPAPNEYGFYNDMDDAVKAARKTKKDILLFITMGGFDDESDDFISGVLQNAAYKVQFEKEYVSVHFDFGEKAFIQSENDEAFNAQVNKNISLVRGMNLQYTPALYLMNCDGYAFADEIYAKSFSSVETLYSLVSEYKEDFDTFRKMIDFTKKGKPADRVKAINVIYQVIEDQYLPTYINLYKQVPEIDKKNESGLVSYLYFVYTMEESRKYIQGGDYYSAVQVFRDSATSGYLSGEELQQAYYMTGQLMIQGQSPDIPAIIYYLQAAVDAAPETDFAENCRNILAQIQELLPETEEKLLEEN